MPQVVIERDFSRRDELFKVVEWVKARVPSKEYHIKFGHTPYYDSDADFDADIETVTAEVTVWSSDADLVLLELCLRI